MEANNDQLARRCQWCATPAADADTHCRSCGANLAQRESLGELVIPGVTHVDPGLKAYADQPLRIPGASPSQAVAPNVIGAAAVAGGPAALVALVGLGAVAATEYATAGRGHMTDADLDKLGQPSEAAMQMLRKLDEEQAEGDGPAQHAGDGQPGSAPSPPDAPGTDKPTIV